MNKFHGFLTLAFVAALALTSCGDTNSADNQKRVDDSIAAAVEKQKAYDDSIAKAVVDTTKKVETPATDVKAKEQGGVKPTVGGDKGKTAAEVKPTTDNASGNNKPSDPKADSKDAEKGGKTGEVKKDAEKAGNVEPAKTGEKAVKGGKVSN